MSITTVLPGEAVQNGVIVELVDQGYGATAAKTIPHKLDLRAMLQIMQSMLRCRGLRLL